MDREDDDDDEPRYPNPIPVSFLAKPMPVPVVNVSGEHVRISVATDPRTDVELAPGGVADVSPALTVRMIDPSQDKKRPQPSLVEALTRGKVLPGDDPRAAALLEAHRIDAALAARGCRPPSDASPPTTHPVPSGHRTKEG